MRTKKGFTLIELLTVIAIIGILAAIIIPVTGKVRSSAKKAKTKAQFSQLALGIELFKQEYGYYPVVPYSKLNGDLAWNAVSVTDKDRNMLMIELLSGKGAGTDTDDFVSDEKNRGSATGTPRAQNKKGISFYTFNNDELLVFDADEKAIVDGYGNLEIVVLVDRNGDGMIMTDEPVDDDGGANADDALNNEFPEVFSNVTPNKSLKSDDIRKAKLSPVGTKHGVRASVVIYSAGEGFTGDSNDIPAANAVFSW